MKHLRPLCLLALFAHLAAALAPAQTLPTPAYTPVTATADGSLRTPGTFFSANQAAIVASVSSGAGLIPFEAPSSASGDSTRHFLLWSPAPSANIGDDDGVAGWVTAPTFRSRLGLGTSDTPTFGGVQVSGEIDATGAIYAQSASFQFGLSLGNATINPKTTPGLIALTPPEASGTLLTTNGNGSGLTALNASALSSGTVPAARLPAANDTTIGAVELATSAEAIAGTDATRANTPAAGRAALSAYVDPIAATRQSIDWLLSNGVDTNRRLEWLLGAAGNIAGSPLSEVGHVFRVPTTLPAAEATIVGYGLGGTNIGSTNAGWVIALSPGGALTLRNNTDASNRGTWEIAGWRALYSGQIVRIDWVSAADTATLPTVYVNGVAATGWTQTVANGTVPNWQAPALPATVRVCGFGWPNTEFRPGVPINRALTAQEIAQMVQTGSLLPVDRPGGSMVPITAGSFVARTRYRILTVGTTDFILIGASANTVGVEFTATGVGTGTGTALPIGALLQPEINRTSQVLDHGPNRISGIATAGVRPITNRDPVGIRGSISAPGNILGLGVSDPLFHEAGLIKQIRVKPTANAATTTTWRLNTSGGTVVGTVTTTTLNQWITLPFAAGSAFEVSAGDKFHITTDAALDFEIDWSRR